MSLNNDSILLADDHPLLLKGLEDHLYENGYKNLATASNGLDAYHQIVTDQPTLAILDINMPKMSGLEVAKVIRNKNLSTKIIIITLYREEELYQEAMSLGVSGYLFKSQALEEIVTCVTTVLQSQKYTSPTISKYFLKAEPSENVLSKLTPSELKILRLISENKTSPEIAELLFISLKTVTKHRSNIVAKLDLEKKTNSLLLWARENKGLVMQ